MHFASSWSAIFLKPASGEAFKGWVDCKVKMCVECKPMKVKDFFKSARYIAVFSLLFTVLPVAHADVFGFIDSKGVAHIANRQLDARYQPLNHPHDVYAVPTDKVTTKQITNKPVMKLPPTRPVEVDPNKPSRYADLVERTARNYNLNPQLLDAIIRVESGYNPNAHNAGARGLMQLMPATARRFGVTRPNDPAQNIKAGAQYLRYLLDHFKQQLPLALAAYNAGEGIVGRFNGLLPANHPTRTYVAKVLATFMDLTADQDSTNDMLPTVSTIGNNTGPDALS